jgi:transcriptional regulator with XRE-family HTH domain
MEFKNRLRELRIEKNVSQIEIAKILNMSKMAISHWEKGNSEPSIDQLKVLARFFDVSIDYLVGFSD